MSTFVVGVTLGRTFDVIGPFTDTTAAHEFVGEHCPAFVVGERTQWLVVGEESCQYSPRAWVDLQLGDHE